MQKKVLSLLLAAAMLLSVSVTPVLAADNDTADDTSAVQTVEAAADEAAEEVTVIDEVSETAATVNAAATEEAEEEVTIIDEVSETAETVDSYTAYTYSDGTTKYTATVLNDCSDTSTFTKSSKSGQSNDPSDNSKTIQYTITDIVDTSNSGVAVVGSGWRGVNITVTGTISEDAKGIYFELLDARSNIKGLGNSESGTQYLYLSLAVGSDSATVVVDTTDAAISDLLDKCAAYNPTTGLSGTYGDGTYSDGTLTQFFIPWETFGVSASDVAAAGSYTFDICLKAGTMAGKYVSSYQNPVMYDNFGVYTTEADTSGGGSEPTEPEYDYDTTSEARSENDVVVVQDFEYSKTDGDDIYCNGGYGDYTAAIGTEGYLDSQFAQFTVPSSAVPQNLRIQTSATALAGAGLYFEVDSSAEFDLSSNATLAMFDVSSAAEQLAATSNDQIGSTVTVANFTSDYIYSVESDTNTYVVMVPWSVFGIDDISEISISNALSVRIWVDSSIVSANMVIAVDNIGFYTFGSTDNVLSSNTDGTVAVTTSTIYGYGSDTIYAKVATDDLANYSADDNIYPTTTLTYGDNNYIFAGWYSDNGTTACGSMPTSAAYAKFVDENVMTLGFQVLADTTTASTSTTLRLVTTVDSLYYSNVGFILTMDDWTCTFTTENVYGTISGDATVSYDPTAFSDASLYFVTATVTDISSDHFTEAITVTVFWETLDGTTVTSTLDTSYGGLAITGNGTTLTAIINEATGNAE